MSGRRQLAAHAAEAELVLRDPQSTVQQVLVGAAAVFAIAVARIWIGPIELSPRVVAVVGMVVIVGVGASLFRLPVWVRVGPSGVAFRAWWRTGQFDWQEIESFEVGNPSEPRLAYILVKPTGGSGHRAIRAPMFSTISPSELVQRLEQKRRIFSTRR